MEMINYILDISCDDLKSSSSCFFVDFNCNLDVMFLIMEIALPARFRIR